MRSERWATKSEIRKVLKEDAAGLILQCEKGERLFYDGEGHGMILGVSGTGKSRRGTIPMTKSIIRKGESGIILDAKGEIYKNTRDEIPDSYDVHVINFRNLLEDESEHWNPLAAPYEKWCMGDKSNRKMAEDMLEELVYSMYKLEKHREPYWINEAKNVFRAFVYTLFLVAEPEEVNLVSLYYMMAKGEEKFVDSTYLKEMTKQMKDHPNVAMQLLSYVTTASETAAGIRSMFLEGLSVATRSESVREFLSQDDLQLNQLTGDKPTLIYIIIPDETQIYDELAEILVSQLIGHYVQIAEKFYDGKLPIRLHVLLEELGNIGHAINNLERWMTNGRSRNIRIVMVLQSMAQLRDVYGESKATTIIDNCDVKVVFRVNHWQTLAEISGLCGEKERIRDGVVVREPLITPSQLAAMENGQALVMISGKTKYITWLPDVSEMYPEIKVIGKYTKKTKRTEKTVGYFDIQKYVRDKKVKELKKRMEMSRKNMEGTLRERMEADRQAMKSERTEADRESEKHVDIDEMVKQHRSFKEKENREENLEE